MYKKIYLAVVGIILPFFCFAQIEQYAIGGLGGEIGNSEIRLVHSIGDLAGTHIGSATDIELVQGFAQCFKDNLCWATGIEAYENSSITFRPNPTSSKLYLEGEYTLIQRYELYSSTGQKLESQAIYQNQISLEQLSPGMYYLRVFGIKGELSLIAKVVKR